MSKRGENIRKRKDGRWEARLLYAYKPDGTPLYRSFYGRTYREAKEKMARASACPPSTETAAPAITLSEILHHWVEESHLRWKPSTYQKYCAVIERHILPQMGQCNASELTSAQVNTFLAGKSADGRLDGRGGLSASCVRTIATVLHSALEFAVDEELCAVKIPKISRPAQEKNEPDALTPQEQKQLEQAVLRSTHPTDFGILLALRLGLRLGEICALRWDDVELTRGQIHIQHTLCRISEHRRSSDPEEIWQLEKPKTPSSRRTIPLSEKLIELLCTARQSSKSDFVVSKKNGFANPRTMEYRFQRILRQCGLPHYKFHVLRHTFATRCVESGVDVKSLSEILGHSDASVTLNVYVHSSLEQKRLQMMKLPQLSA